MLNLLFSQLAPHSCCSCGAIGAVLCESCKYNINIESIITCALCGQYVASGEACKKCVLPYGRMWCVGDYDDELKNVIQTMKFKPSRQACAVLAELLSHVVGRLPQETVIVPVPTVRSHVRERGFDHAELIAKTLARLQDCQYDRLLQRANRTKQRGSTRQERLQNATDAFSLRHSAAMSVPHLLVDDVMTTGATIHHATMKLREAGAEQVWVAVAARQAGHSTQRAESGMI